MADDKFDVIIKSLKSGQQQGMNRPSNANSEGLKPVSEGLNTKTYIRAKNDGLEIKINKRNN